MYQVLLVDDEPIIYLGIRKMMNWESTPYRLCGTARNGEEALQYIQAHSVDMILTDLKMPVMSGLEMIRALKQQNVQIPILVLSNYSDFGLVREALLEGAVDYLLKVNLTEESLLQQLDKMAQIIETSQQNMLQEQQQVQLLEQQNREVLQAKLRAFFLDESYTVEDILPQLQESGSFQPPFAVYTVYFRDGDIKQEKLRRILSHTENMITVSFSPTEVNLSKLHHDELLCFISSMEMSQQIFCEKLRQLQRQISTFFSVTPIVCYSLGATDLSTLRQAYFQCATSRKQCFYDPDATFIPAEEREFKQELKSGMLDEFVSNILGQIRVGNLNALDHLVHQVLHQWAEFPLEPETARQLCAKVLEYLEYVHYSGAKAELSKITRDRQQVLSKTTTIFQLEDEFIESLRLLLPLHSKLFDNYKREIQTVLIFLHAHYFEKITLDSIADSVGLNRSYLCRLFKKELSISIFSYLNRLRMETAAHLIRNNSDIYIREIAEQVGIDDPFYFTRKFKAHYGVSPREYASKHQHSIFHH